MRKVDDGEKEEEKKQAVAEVVQSSGLVKLKLKIPQVQVKLQQTSTKLKLSFKRQVHYFFRGGWCGRIKKKAISVFN